jgi:hypothetical protein
MSRLSASCLKARTNSGGIFGYDNDTVLHESLSYSLVRMVAVIDRDRKKLTSIPHQRHNFQARS